MLAWLVVARALAGVPEDLATAADTNLPRETRSAAFARLAAPGGTDALVRVAEDAATAPGARWVAIRALGPMGDDASRIALLQFLAATDAQVRIAALGAIGQRGDRSLASYAAARLGDPALLVRAAAADALGRLRAPDTLGDLERALKDPGNHYRGTSLWVRRMIVDAMAAIGTDAAVPPLARALDDADPEVVAAAKRGLAGIAGFSYAEGRTPEQEREAWKRWAGQ